MFYTNRNSESKWLILQYQLPPSRIDRLEALPSARVLTACVWQDYATHGTALAFGRQHVARYNVPNGLPQEFF